MANSVSCTRSESTILATLLVKGIVPMFGVLEALLSDHGAILLLCLMGGVYKLLGIKKLNNTTYQPQCNDMATEL